MLCNIDITFHKNVIHDILSLKKFLLFWKLSVKNRVKGKLRPTILISQKVTDNASFFRALLKFYAPTKKISYFYTINFFCSWFQCFKSFALNLGKYLQLWQYKDLWRKHNMVNKMYFIVEKQLNIWNSDYLG